MKSRLFIVCVIGLCWVQFSRADTLVLNNGEHIQGEIVAETAREVSIRRTNSTGNIRFVQKYEKTDIARIERTATQPASATKATAPATRPASSEPDPRTTRIEDKPALLEGAILKYEKPDYYAAGLELNLLIVNSSPAELQQFSATVEDRLKMSLAEMAATAHFYAAIERSRGRAVQLPPVTDYEKPELIPILEDAYTKALEAQIKVEEEEGGTVSDRRPVRVGADGRLPDLADEGNGFGHGPHRRLDPRAARAARDPRERLQPPALANTPFGLQREGRDGNGLAAAPEQQADGLAGGLAPTSRPTLNIASWLSRPEDFNGSRQEASALMIQVYHARSLLAERMRLDPEMRTDQKLKAELLAERARLDALLKSIKARASGALTPAEREAMEAQIRNRRDAAMREEWRRRNAAFNELERIRQQQLQEQGIGVPPPGPTRETE